MKRLESWLAKMIASALDPVEREVALGDLTETRQSATRDLRDLFGLAARRQLALWKHWQPWLLLIAVVIPLGTSLGARSQVTATLSVVRMWSYLVSFQLSDFSDELFFNNFANLVTRLLFAWLSLGVWAWGVGFGVTILAKRTRIVSVPALAVFLCLGSTLLAGRPALFSRLPYRFAIPAFLMVACCILVPALGGSRHASRRTSLDARSQAFLLIFILAPVICPMEVSFGWYFDQHAPTLVLGRNLLGFLGYWPVAYWAVCKWRTLRPIQNQSARS